MVKPEEQFDFGTRLRRLRQARGLTLPALAIAANITKGYLSKIERSPNPPAFSTLQTLAAALDTEVTSLLAQEKSTTVSPNLEIHAPDAGTWQASHRLGGYDFLPLLQSYRNKYLSPFVMRIPPGSTSFFKHDGEEFLYVLEGEIELEYEGKRHPLAPGASAYLDSRLRHRFHNHGKRTVKLLAVNFVYRRF